MQKERDIVEIGLNNDDLKYLIVNFMLTKRYDEIAVRDFIRNQFGYDSFKGKNHKSERKKIEDRFKELEKNKIVLSTLKETQSYKKSYWKTELVSVGEKQMERLVKEEVKDVRKSNSNQYILNKNIQIENRTKPYTKSELKEISFIITEMYNENSTFSTNLVNGIIEDRFGDKTNFIKGVVTHMGLLQNETMNSSPYSLDLLLSLIQLQSKLNLSIVTDSSKFDLSGVKIKSIIFGKESFDIKFKNITVTLTDINQIKSIQSYDNNGLREDIEKLKAILSEHSTKVTEEIMELIKGVESIDEAAQIMFFQPSTIDKDKE